MVRVVGTHFVIASILVATGKPSIPLTVLLDDMRRIRAGIDNIVIDFHISEEAVLDTVYNYPDYFDGIFDDFSELIGVRLRKGMRLADLENYFIILPQDIIDFIAEVVRQRVAMPGN